MAAIVASNFAVAAAPKVSVRKLSARKAAALPGAFSPTKKNILFFLHLL